MRLLFTIPHHFDHPGAAADDSQNSERRRRSEALTRCVRAIHHLFGSAQHYLTGGNLAVEAANRLSAAEIDICICTTGDAHLLSDIELDQAHYEQMPVDTDAAGLGFACHALLRERLGDYDYFCLLSDDLVLHDPWFFLKLNLFGDQAGINCLLQPNRYEVSSIGPFGKLYIDAPDGLPRHQTILARDRQPPVQKLLTFAGLPVICRQTENPHSGCFFLSGEQMEFWARQPFFLDRNVSLVDAATSTATLSIARTFKIYKPASRCANFLEIEHHGDTTISRLQRERPNLFLPPASLKGEPDEQTASPVVSTSSQRDDSATVPVPNLLIQSVMMAPKACEHLRIREPAEALSALPGVRTIVAVHTMDLAASRDDEQKVIILQRPILKYPDCVAPLRTLRDRGYVIVIEYDDDPYRRREHIANDFLTFRTCHAVQTSTEALAECLREHNPNVAVFANQIKELPPPRDYQDDTQVNIFFGALNRQRDWAPIMPALNEVIRQHSDRLHFKVVHDEEFFRALETDRKEFEPWCPYERYLAILRSCDIGLLPLEHNRVNCRKSDLKFIEHAAHGVAVLASPTVYGKTIDDGKTGSLYHGIPEVGPKLNRLVEDTPFRRSMAAAAYRYVSEHRLLKHHINERYQWYRGLIDDLPRLERDVSARAPEVFG